MHDVACEVACVVRAEMSNMKSPILENTRERFTNCSLAQHSIQNNHEFDLDDVKISLIMVKKILFLDRSAELNLRTKSHQGHPTTVFSQKF